MSLRDGKRRYEKLKQLTKVAKSKEAFYKYRQSRLESGIQPTSLNRELSYIRAAYRLAVADEITTSNPFHNIKALPELQKELSYLTIDQIKLLLKEVDNSGNKDLSLVVRLSLATGARWSEAEGIKKGHVQDNRATFIETKNGKSRTIPISQDLAVQILDRKPVWRYFKPCYSAYRRAFQRTGIQLPKGQLAHVLRHTFASHFIMNGGDILTLQKILGHSDLKMTMRYAHLSPDYFIQAIKYNPIAYI